MHRVLAIPELLDTIFRTMDDFSNLNNALVSKNWSEIALDSLWRTVRDLYCLFNLLAPLRQTSSGHYEFSRLPESSDWHRFQRYAKRVRELIYDETASHGHTLCQSVFDDIARTRITLTILPNMHTLNWKAAVPLCVMFMHSKVKNFLVHLPEAIGTSSPRPFFEDINARMPNITYLDIRTNISMKTVEDQAIQLLSNLPKLQKITFPRYHFSTRIAQCLSRLPKLGVIEFQYFQEQGIGDEDDIKDFKPDLEEGAFPALWDLSMVAGYIDAQRFLSIPFAPSNITMFYIESPFFETPLEVQKVIAAVAENCQLLKCLALVSPRRPVGSGLELEPTTTSSSNTTIDPRRRINMETLKPLLSCPNLTTLEIIHEFAMDLSLQDIELLAMRWPSLETLTLNNEPSDYQSSDLTLEALVPFAKYCPNLVHLALFIDASMKRVPRFSSTIPQYPAFKSLRKLSMGLSIIDNPQSVAIFLSQMIPLHVKCHIEAGLIWEESFHFSESDLQIGGGEEEEGVNLTVVVKRCQRWEVTNELVPLLVGVRNEERERTREVRKELEEVQMKMKNLVGKFEITG